MLTHVSDSPLASLCMCISSPCTQQETPSSPCRCCPWRPPGCRGWPPQTPSWSCHSWTWTPREGWPERYDTSQNTWETILEKYWRVSKATNTVTKTDYNRGNVCGERTNLLGASFHSIDARNLAKHILSTNVLLYTVEKIFRSFTQEKYSYGNHTVEILK